MATQPTYLEKPFNPCKTIVNSNGTTAVTIIDCSGVSGANNAPNGCVIKDVRLISDDSSSRVVQFLYNDCEVGQVTIPANSGLASAAIDLFAQVMWSGMRYDALGNKYFQMSPGDTLKWKLVSGSVTAAKKLGFITLLGAKF